MTEMQLRIIDVVKIINSNLTTHEKIVQACKSLSGLDITHATQTNKHSIYKHFNEMNSILSNYEMVIKTWEDYQLISEKHLNKMLNSVKRLCKNLIF